MIEGIKTDHILQSRGKTYNQNTVYYRISWSYKGESKKEEKVAKMVLKTLFRICDLMRKMQ